MYIIWNGYFSYMYELKRRNIVLHLFYVPNKRNLILTTSFEGQIISNVLLRKRLCKMYSVYAQKQTSAYEYDANYYLDAQHLTNAFFFTYLYDYIHYIPGWEVTLIINDLNKTFAQLNYD